jgi:hypothetical protein
VSCSRSGNIASPSPATETTSNLQGDPALGPQLAAVRAATAQFQDVEVAMASGYLNPAAVPCEQTAAGTMGHHSANPALTGSQALDPLHPEVLLRNPATNQVAPWVSPSPWPSNYEVVTPTPRLFGQTFNGPMPGHVPGMPWHWDLHVWIWANNPTGMFEQWNPAISCN